MQGDSEARSRGSAAAERAYAEERAYWLRHAEGHFAEADLPFIRWHQEQVLASFDLPPGELIAEMGAGAGKLLREHDRVLLVDFSPEILAKARQKQPRHLAVCASVDALPFRDGSLKHVVANNMLHHVKGEGLLDPTLDEFARVLRADGRLYVNDRNPTLLHHGILSLGMTAKRALRRVFGEFGGCGSYNEPMFTRRDWRKIERRFRFLRERHYYSVAIWLVDSIAKGLFVLLCRRDRGFIARIQLKALPLLLWIERRLGARSLAIERSLVAEKRPEAAHSLRATMSE